jgi:hypothetical protein
VLSAEGNRLAAFLGQFFLAILIEKPICATGPRSSLTLIASAWMDALFSFRC